MNGLNPIAGSLYQAANVQRMQSSERDAAVQRVQKLRKNIAASGDDVEHNVESSDVISALHDEEREQNERKKRKPRHAPDIVSQVDDDETPHLDLTA